MPARTSRQAEAVAISPFGTLARLVNGADLLLSRYWGRASLYVPGASLDGVAQLLRIAEVEQLLTTRPLASDLVRVYRDGQAEPPERSTVGVRTASHVEHRSVAADAVLALFRRESAKSAWRRSGAGVVRPWTPSMAEAGAPSAQQNR